MADEETKPAAVPVEAAANETDDHKKLEAEVETKPALNGSSTIAEVDKELKESKPAVDAKVEAIKAEEADSKTAVSDSEQEEKVVQDAVKQITFYFSDSNLPYDKFLFHQAQSGLADQSAPMGTGFIPLSTVLSFKRMQDIIARSTRSPTICEYAIVNALRAAYPSKDDAALLEISSDGNNVRRRLPLTEPGKTDQISRSVYVKGFPDEDEKPKRDGGEKGRRNEYVSSQLQKDLEHWIQYLGLGKVNAVRMRRDESKKFKNSVFVEYATVESAQSLLELDPKPTYPGQSEPVEVMSKKDFVDMKAKEKGIAPQYGSGRPPAAGPGDKRAFNAFRDWNAGEAKPKAVSVFVEGKEMEVDTETGKIKNPDELTFTLGKVLKFDGASISEDVNPYGLKQSLQTLHPPAFVDLEKGKGSGVVFFKDIVSDETLEKIKDANITLGGEDDKLTWATLDADAEKAYHLERANKRASIALEDAKSGKSRDRDDDRRRGGGGGHGRGRGGRGNARGGRGRGRGGDRDRNGGGGDRTREWGRKRGRDDEDSSPKKEASPQKGNAIAVPKIDSAGPSEPATKKPKNE